ncbi:MAG: hypothetical protein J3R72DRAFT_442361 [Linnemannia gamsii]|nr:MAG: hypothetical protein J3R72DRAFT_442361 [Linnemannia gamsii]
MDKEEVSQTHDHQAYPMQEVRGQQQQQHLDTYGQSANNTNSQQQHNGHQDNDNNGEHEMMQINRASAPTGLDAELPPLPPSNNENAAAIQRNSVHSVRSNHSNHSQTLKHEPHVEPYSYTSSPSVSVIKAPKERPTCLPWCCPCIRLTWVRIICCLCLVLVLIIAILAILVFAVFKLPTIDYLGTVGAPQFTFNKGNTTFGVDMVANISVKNPNPLGFSFQLIAVGAYFPGFKAALGGRGNVTNVDFPSHSTQSIQFPISVAYDRHQDPGLRIIKTILSKCGILGGTVHELTINYDVMASVKVLGISMNPNLDNQTYSFTCPENIREIATEIPGGIAAIIGDIKGGVGGIIGGINGTIGGIGDTIGDIGDTIGNIGDKIGDKIGDLIGG